MPIKKLIACLLIGIMSSNSLAVVNLVKGNPQTNVSFAEENNLTEEEYLEIINGDDVIRGMVRAAMEGEGSSVIYLEEEDLQKPISIEELQEYLNDEERTSFYLSLVGGWNYEYFTSELELYPEHESDRERYDLVKKYSVRNISDWSWIGLFESKNIDIAFDSFTETDYMSLKGSKFYEKMQGKAYSMRSTGMSRVIDLDFQKIWPGSLLKENSSGQNTFNTFGGRFPINTTKDSYQKISLDSEDYIYTDPDGVKKPLSHAQFNGLNSIVLIDDGTYLYFHEEKFNEEPATAYDKAYYNASVEGKIIAKYDFSYDEDGKSQYELSENIPVSYDDETGTIVEEKNEIEYSDLQKYEEFKFGGPRNIYAPLMISLGFNNEEESKWQFQTSYWNPLFKFSKYQVKSIYTDTEGNELMDPEITKGALGESYSVEAKDIPGYKLKSVEGNQTGEFGEEEIIVKFIYEIEESAETHISYVNGYEDGTFKPEGSTTRAEAASLFARLKRDEQKNKKTKSNIFSDVLEGSWYKEDVEYLNSLSIINGYPDGTFKPENNITRAEFAAMVEKFDNSKTKKFEFSDVGADHWAKDIIASVSNKGFMVGYPDGTFKPENNITRAESIKVINNILNRKPDKDYIANHPDEIKQYKDLDKEYWAYDTIVEASNSHDYKRNSDDSETWTKINN